MLLLIAYLLLLFQILADLLRDRSASGFAKVLWVIGLIFIPLLTALAYLIVRGNGMAERQQRDAARAQESAEDYIRSVALAKTASARRADLVRYASEHDLAG